jgi:uncharacterized protein (DUF736 family)
MANIGTFKKSGTDYLGETVTLSVQTKNVRIIPEATRASDNAPSHRIFVGRAEIGAAWSKRSAENRDYLSVSRSSMAVVILASPNTCGQSAKARLVVISSEVFS